MLSLDFLKAIGNKVNKDLLYYLKEHKSRDQLSHILPQYFPYSHYTIKYYDLELIVNQILFSNTKNILELGSGLSTLVFGLLGKKLSDLKVHVLEHDKQWYELMNRLLEMNNIDNVFMEYVPLKSFNQNRFTGNFFDMTNVQLNNYDAIIIDGPPANHKQLIHSRYPAINIIQHHLTKGGFFYFDDINRKGEQDCLNAWSDIISIKKGLSHRYGKGQIYFFNK